MARSRFPGDEFGLDFHISHLQFYQPEAVDSDEEEDGGGGGGGGQQADLEVALQLSMGNSSLPRLYILDLFMRLVHILSILFSRVHTTLQPALSVGRLVGR